jgi:glycosyltransferase involved in cell wall biosynthesis
MIVKNESKIITRMLASVSPYIDSYCICDTGSTDNTEQVINEYFQSLQPPIPGVVIHEPFRDFEYSRSYALKACEGREKADYVLLLDADMIFWTSLNPVEFHQYIENSNRDFYFIMQGSETFYYKNVRIVRNNRGVCYKGVTHEYVSTPDGFCSDLFDLRKVFIKDIGDGGCKSDKFERDIRLLKKGLEDKPDDQRYTFYLANSYYCLLRFDEAIPIYKKRAELGGFGEEVWYSMFRMGECYRHKGDIANAVHWYMNAYQYSDYRVENIYEVVKMFREKGQNRLAKMYYDVAKRICDELPHDDHLFMQKDVYEFRLDYEKSIFGYYCTEKEVPRKELRQICMKLINHPHFEYKENVLSNYKFYTLGLRGEYCVLEKKTHSPVLEKGLEVYRNLSASIQEISTSQVVKDWVGEKFHGNTPYWSSTPSLLSLGNEKGWLCNFRFVNYYIGEKGEYINQKHIQTVNVVMEIGKDGKWKKESLVELEYNNAKDALYKGLEDVRLFMPSKGEVSSIRLMIQEDSDDELAENMAENKSKKNMDKDTEEEEGNTQRYRIFYNCNRGLEQSGVGNQQRIAVECGQIEYSYPFSVNSTNGNFLNGNRGGAFARTVENGLVWKEGGMTPVEKNWVFLPSNGGGVGGEICEKMVYNWHPYVVGDYTHRPTGVVDYSYLYRNMIEYKTPPIFKYFRGSTNGIRVGKEIWCLCHIVSYEERRYYYHTIVALDSETYQPLRFTGFFTFEKEKVEYCLGMTEETIVYDFGGGEIGGKVVKEKYILFGYSTMDRTTKTCMISKKVLEDMFYVL